jgi:acyl dehydratase
MVKTPEEVLEEVKQFIGKETEPAPGRYPVEYDPIRRFCHMVDDDNPLFLDPEYAKTTKYGDVISPPFMIGNFGDRMMPNWPPEEQVSALRDMMQHLPPTMSFINLTTEWEFFRPVKVGERLSGRDRIADLYIKSIRMDPKAMWFVFERIYSDEKGETVALWRNIGLAIRPPEEVKAEQEQAKG